MEQEQKTEQELTPTESSGAEVELETPKEMESTESSNNQVSKDTTISEVLMINPDKSSLLAEIMTEFGIHCVGCGAASFETLEQGVLGHGFSNVELTKLITDLNAALGAVEAKEESKEDLGDFKLILTDSAAKKISDSINKRDNDDSILRVSVLPGGCSGFMYELEFTDKKNDDDLNFTQDGVNLAVPKESMESLNGTIIDYVDDLNESGFKFENPTAKKECGCGKSFG